MFRKIILAASLCLMASTSMAIEPFIITDVKVSGNGRLDDGTIFNYLPLKVGDEVDDEEARLSIKALFETGFFRNVKLSKDGSTLVVEVEERPSIAGIKLLGNKDIKTEQIEEMLTATGLADGRILNQRRLNEIIKSLTDAYFSRGRYSATVKEDVTILDQNRAKITLNIDEGRVATIKEINIVGNEAFPRKTLFKQMQLTTKRGFGFSRKDLYSKQKLEGDQETLRSFYADQGYFEFDIRSTNVTISPNKQDISLFISLIEGPQYKTGKLDIIGADSLGIDTQSPLALVKAGSVFSRKAISDVRKTISDALSDKGFGNAVVNPVPNVNEAEQLVDVRFEVTAGPRLYVRRINILGNTITQDDVIRRELRQLEGARFSAKDVRRSQERIQRLGHFEAVEIDTFPVPGVPDQVDLQVKVNERASTGSINFAVGYADVEGVIYQLGYNQRNFLGTGRELSIKLDNSNVTDVYQISYTNPYYTVDGVSRSFYLNSTQVDSARADTAEYFSDSIEIGTGYRIPISENNSVKFDVFAEKIDLESSKETPPEILTFIDKHSSNTNLGLRVSLAKDSLNDYIFPSAGSLASISLEAAAPGSDLEYYKVSLSGAKYFPLFGTDYAFKTKIKLGYGGAYGEEEDLPFYKNYYAGGPGSVRGFKSRSLGPLDTGNTPEPIGGDRRVLANLELLMPAFGSVGSKDKRLTAFVDAGMVYGVGQKASSDSLRMSAGISLQWYSVIGPLTLSYAYPLNEEEADKLQKFQISLGTLFR